MFDIVKAPGESMADIDINYRQPATPAAKGFYARFAKRVLDIAAIVAALPIILPIIGICALLIRRDGGPAFYGQQRVGKDGTEFTCWKLRSMVIDAEKRILQMIQLPNLSGM